MDFYKLSVDETKSELNVNNDGLSYDEAEKRILTYGKNEIIEKNKKSKLKILLNQFSDMMIIILIIVALFMLFYGIFYSHEYTDPIVIFVVVILNAIIGYTQEEKAEVTLEGLKKYATNTTKVKRDGKVIIIDSTLLVPGDIVLLEAGDKIPADARIVDESNLLVNESILTGESVPVKKQTESLNGKLQIQDQTNMLFSGCMITSGKTTAIVTNTGMMSELGRIAVSLNTLYEVETPLQKRIKEISKKITLIIFIILIFIFIYGFINEMKLLEIILLCVSLAVAAIPEGLPAVITICLSTGAKVLARKNTIVRQMNAVETLGATDVICSDKTGTITQNKMKVKELLIEDEEMFKYIALLANDAIINDDVILGDPTETCLFDYFKEQGVDVYEFIKNNKKVVDAPFDSIRKMMSTVIEIDNKKYVLTKGSLENLLVNCKYAIIDNKKVKMTNELIDSIRDKEKSLAGNALRVIGFAYKEITNIPSKSAYLINEESNLIYVGMVGIIDPPRESVKYAVLKCKNAGIRPIMITGDSLVTACAIAKEVGIIKNTNEGILGVEIDNLADDELLNIVKKYNVYARVSPEHKLKIVKALQRLGSVVAMTGDGVNDAPAIKDAHVGVGMGITGTEVTKSVADVILLDDSFSTIVDAVEEGRRIYTNIRNNIVFCLSTNFAEILTVLVGMITNNTILIPIHILFVNLVTDSIPSICLAFEKAENGIMNNSPRGLNKPMFTPFAIASILTTTIIETIVVLLTYFITLKYYSSEIAGTLALLSLVMQELIYAVCCRNLKEMIYKQGIFSNKQLNIGLSVLIIIEILVFFTPIGKVINVQSVEYKLLLSVIVINLITFIIYEFLKLITKKLFKD